MKKIIILLFFILIGTSFITDNNIDIDKQEAKKAFEFLLEIRKNPKKYCNELDFVKDVKSIPKVQLKWNDTLAKVAENKAYDMAKRNYFDHVDPDGYGMNYFINKAGYKLNTDWLIDKSDNTFESITAEDKTGEDAIKTLIIDEGVIGKGHRVHLLSLDDFRKNVIDIGIGFARCKNNKNQYSTYVSVLIAKHDF